MENRQTVEMSDLEMVKLCAEAMRIKHRTVKDGAYLECPDREVDYAWDGVYEYDSGCNMWSRRYSHLHDDAQLLSLARKFPLEFEQAVIEWANHVRRGEGFDVNRYFCERIARIEQ